ncbi:hypothetical protein SHIRM173S_09503 [Streptomyces hirsutus]
MTATFNSLASRALDLIDLLPGGIDFVACGIQPLLQLLLVALFLLGKGIQTPLAAPL